MLVAERSLEMNKIQTIVNIVLEQQKQQLAPSTYDVHKNYLKHLTAHAEEVGISEPCQELYDSYVARAITPDLRFQLFHAVRLVDREAGTKAFTPEGTLYNEPKLPSSTESQKALESVSFPITDGSIDTGYLIRRAESEMEYLIFLHLPVGSTYRLGGNCMLSCIFMEIQNSPE